MSALVAWGVPETALPTARFPRRASLQVAEGERAECAPTPRHHGAAMSVTTSPPLRLTARGRLTRTLVLFGLLSLFALMRWAPVTDADGLAVDHHTIVRPGQTLSQVAREQLPQLPVADAVARLQRLNRLTAPEVSAGQSLAIPLSR